MITSACKYKIYKTLYFVYILYLHPASKFKIYNMTITTAAIARRVYLLKVTTVQYNNSICTSCVRCL